MASLFDTQTRQQMLDRVSKITPDSKRTFGSMRPGEMICHMKDVAEIALGEKPVTRDMPLGLVVGLPPIRSYVINKLTWPKGKLASPANQMETVPGDFAADLDTLKALLNKFCDRGPNGEFGTHALFGKMDGPLWGALMTKHLEHHLGQFGV